MIQINELIRVANSDVMAYKAIAYGESIKDCSNLLVRQLHSTLGSEREVKAMLVALAILSTKAPNFTKMLTDQTALNTLKQFIAPTNAVAFAKMIPRVLELAKQHNLQSDTL